MARYREVNDGLEALPLSLSCLHLLVLLVIPGLYPQVFSYHLTASCSPAYLVFIVYEVRGEARSFSYSKSPSEHSELAWLGDISILGVLTTLVRI